MQKPKQTSFEAPVSFRREADFFDSVVPTTHAFRKLSQLINFSELVRPLRSLYSDFGQTGIDVEKGFKALLVQFWEDYSDREMEHAMRENMAVRWFCGFGLTETTPDHSYCHKLRNRIGTKHLADLFKQVGRILEQKGLVGKTFYFIDASSIITKNALWKERDKAIAEGEAKLNNQNVDQYVADPDARWGAKGKDKFWFGYKRNVAVDMRFGLIVKVCVTNASVLDYEVIESVLPDAGMVFLDKLYDVAEAHRAIRAKGLGDATLLKSNRKNKNRDLDRWRSSVRMPFESTFSKQEKRARYRSTRKVAFQCFFEAIVHNLQKAVTFLPIPTPA